MKITSAKFVVSVASMQQLPSTALPEIAFAGRSNVGKSSLLNCLLNRKKLALTSSTPGKTRLINYFEINQQLHFVDLPGYGFAKVPANERARWKQLIEQYMTSSPHLKGIIQLIDSRHGPTPLDKEMIEWLTYLQKPTLIVATKSDKLSNSRLQRQISEYIKELKPMGITEILPFSATTKAGRKELWQAIQVLIGTA
ncbi:YihA family ribosome biogenesis GTP-binding protein [candidate division KSB1 bacterium]|nr:YihA family ribosome biogenesis GTP-binding protein [candidate division KSB1 bacterium]